MSKAKKVANELNFFLSGFSIVMIVVFIISLFNAVENYVKVLTCVMMIIVLGITLKSMSKKLQVFTGIAVYKQIIRSDIHSKKVYCTISIIPENGEKVIYRDINISKKEYNRVAEGTRVMVVNKGNKAIIL